MKKILLTLLFVGLALPMIAGATLYSYYQEQGQNLPSISERTPLAEQCGISNYQGLKMQNMALEACLRNMGNSNILGGTGGLPITDYDSTLATPLTSSATTINVASVTTRDGHTITTSDIAPAIYLVLEPNNDAKKEIVKCTGVSGTAFTGCTRGLAFYGTTETAVSANQKTHGAGTEIVNSNVHYYYVSPAINNTWTAIQTFSSSTVFSDDVSFSSSSIPTYNGTPTYTYGQKQLVDYDWAKDYTDNVGAGGFTSANVSTTRGLSVDGSAPEMVGVNASTTLGMAFDSDGKLYQKTSSTKGILNDSNGIYFDYTRDNTWTGSNTFNGTTTLATTTITGPLTATISYNLLASGTVAISTSTINITSIPYRNFYKLIYWGKNVAASTTVLTFNNDSTTNAYNGAATYINLSHGAWNQIFGSWDITNINNGPKYITGYAQLDDVTTTTGNYWIASTTPITSIQLKSNIATGTYYYLYGIN